MFDEIEQHLADVENVSEEVRENAIVSLAQFNDVRVIFALKKAAREDPSLRLRHMAKKALMELKKEITSVAPDLFVDEEADDSFDLKKLKGYLSSPDTNVRMNAVRSMVTQKDVRAVDVLQGCYATEKEPIVRGSMLIALGILGKSQLSDFLSNVLKNEKDPLVQKSAIDGLSYTKDPTVYPLIIRQFAFSSEKLVERACMKALSKLGKESLIVLFGKMLSSGRVWRRQAVTRAMGRFNSERVVPLLEKALRDESKSVRTQARRSLARLARNSNRAAMEAVDRLGIDLTKTGVDRQAVSLMDSRSLAPTGLEGLEDPDPRVRIQTLQAVVEEGDLSALRTLRERMPQEKDDRVRSMIVNSVARLAERASLPFLKECLTDPVGRVRANAIEAIARFQEESFYPALIEMLRDEDARARANAIVALKECPTVNLDPHIETMVRSQDGRMIRSAIYAIEEVRSEKAIALLADLAHRGSPGLKEKALESLEILKERGNEAARRQYARLKTERPELAVAGAVSDADSQHGTGELFQPEPPPPPLPPAPAPAPVPPRRSTLPPMPSPLAVPPPGPPPPPPGPTRPEEISLPPPRMGPPPPVREPPRRKDDAPGGTRPRVGLPDFSGGFTKEALKAWFQTLPTVWRIATLATIIVWGLVVVLLIAEQFSGGDDF